MSIAPEAAPPRDLDDAVLLRQLDYYRLVVLGKAAGLERDAANEVVLPAALALAPAAPNPFVSRTVLHYDLPAATPVAMRLYDAQGRLVRTLVEPRTQDAGRYSVAWDGLDAQGRGASPGLYFARLDAGSRREVQKVMLSR